MGMSSAESVKHLRLKAKDVRSCKIKEKQERFSKSFRESILVKMFCSHVIPELNMNDCSVNCTSF